jgi:hypothetical protein
VAFVGVISWLTPGWEPLVRLRSDTYDDVRAALVARLAEHDAHRMSRSPS